jgi:uncharacterized protein YcbK (DUF882 family)
MTANFNLNEFRSKCGADVPKELVPNAIAVATNLQVLRDEIGLPITITSGYRSPAHNRRVGGSPNSQHMQANAADIQVKGMTPKQVKDVIERLIKEGKMRNGGIGLYSTFVHYDIGRIRRW